MSLVEIKYPPEHSVTFLGSRSVVRLPDGALLATHDYYGRGCPLNHEAEQGLTSVLRSEDDGATLLQDDSGLEPEDSVRLTGYQYVDWQFDGDDLIYVVRTAARGARNFHDSNRILFGRERGFRSLL